MICFKYFGLSGIIGIMAKEPKKLSLEEIIRRQEQKVMPPAGNPGRKTSYVAVPVPNKKVSKK